MKKQLLFGSLILGSVVTGLIGYSFRTVPSNDFEISKNMEIYGAVYKEINSYYVDQPQPGQLMKEGIDGMLRSLDPYTVYYPESDIEDYRFMTTGQYGGIGSMIQKHGDFSVVTDPYEGYPAQKAGLEAGDIILAVDGKEITGLHTDDVSRLLKGAPGTAVKIKIKRNDEVLDKTLTREEIKIKDVPYFGMVDDKTGYIKLNSFTNSASSEVKAAFKTLKDEKGMKQLIFDLRGNGGGLLNEAVSIVNIFVPQGTEIVRQKGRMPNMNAIYYAKEQPLDDKMPLVVLVDGGSASASEIVSGSIQDLDRGIVIGTQSYGKGLVQQTKNLPYNTVVKLTVAKYYTPSGRCIQRLDYSHKDEKGKAIAVADSLITKFKTRNGREVYDGHGIDPDIKIEEREYSKILISLITQHIIFDYATIFRRSNKTIGDARNFSITDEQYNAFLAYTKDKDYSYTTSSEKEFETLKKIAEEENYFSGAEKEFDELLKKLQPSKEEDLIRFKREIKEFLELEIVGRYYFQTGKTEHALNNDPYILSSVKILNDTKRYNGILDGSVKN